MIYNYKDAHRYWWQIQVEPIPPDSLNEPPLWDILVKRDNITIYNGEIESEDEPQLETVLLHLSIYFTGVLVGCMAHATTSTTKSHTKS